MSKHFLEDLSKDKKKEDFLESVEENVVNISEERILIGEKIQTLLKDNYSKKEVLDIISQKTLLSTQSISSMIEEYSFKKEYNLDISLNFNEIKILKKIFKYQKLSKSDKISFLKQENLKNIISLEFDKISSLKKEKYTHTISFDEEGEILFRNLKIMLENNLGKKISNSELMFYAMIELYNSNPEHNGTIEEIEDNLDF